MKAGEYQPGPVRHRAWPHYPPRCARVASWSHSSLSSVAPTTTNFMIDLGAQPAAAAYSMIQFTYYGIVVGTMAVLASRQYRLSAGVQRSAGRLSRPRCAPRGRLLCRRPHHGRRASRRASRRDECCLDRVWPAIPLDIPVPLHRARRAADRALPARSPEGDAHPQPGQRTLARMASGNDRKAGTEPVGCRIRAYRGSRGAVASASRRDSRRDDRPASVVLSERERSTRSGECRAASPWRRRSRIRESVASATRRESQARSH